MGGWVGGYSPRLTPLPPLCLPPQVDAALLAHPGVAEGVCFAAPDDKYGEVVAAAVVLNEEGRAMPDVVASIKEHCAQRLAAFKVCVVCYHGRWCWGGGARLGPGGVAGGGRACPSRALSPPHPRTHTQTHTPLAGAHTHLCC